MEFLRRQTEGEREKANAMRDRSRVCFCDRRFSLCPSLTPAAAARRSAVLALRESLRPFRNLCCTKKQDTFQTPVFSRSPSAASSQMKQYRCAAKSKWMKQKIPLFERQPSDVLIFRSRPISFVYDYLYYRHARVHVFAVSFE